MVMATPGANSVYVKDHEASNRMRVDFSRDPTSFPVNRYAQIWTTKKQEGYFLEMGLEEAARVVNSDSSEFNWADGAPAPINHDLETFEWKAFTTTRKQYDFVVGDLTIEQATWDIMSQHLEYKKRQAMTARTLAVQTELQNASNYDSTHTIAAASITGNSGNWAAATSQNQNIKRSLNHAVETILKDTLGVVGRKDVKLIVGPELAHIISETQEFVDYLKGSPDAYAQVRGDLDGLNSEYNMPDKLYGIELVVEDAVRVDTRKGAASTTKNFILGQAKAMLVSRVGGLVGVSDAPSFSTVVQFMKEEMTVEKKQERWDRRTLGRVVEDFQGKVVAPVSGFLFTSVS